MSFDKVAIFAAGAVVGGVIGYAATRSKAVKKVTKSTIKAGLKAKDWTVGTYKTAKEEVVTMAKEARKGGKDVPEVQDA
ncbi:MAG TPA: hypothetical protein VKA04_04015 [Pseudodesulfovibrio sp.]|nr:hypothetical protein [Pseudodesulfovibrio sp.]